MTDEGQLGDIYSHGSLIARAHRDVADAVLEDHLLGGSFESWWKTKMSQEERETFLYLALATANAATGGPSEIHRLL